MPTYERVPLRILLLCITLGLASPALAGSPQDALCGKTSMPVSQMANSEKLCRSFALALAEVPNATQREAQALLTPENLATMSALAGIWLASQGVPVVGETVDAALASLGIILMAAQVADLSNALWYYVNLTAAARHPEELKAASAHLARAIALVGVNIVTFILTTKVSSSARRQPPSEKPAFQPAIQSGTPALNSSRRTGHPDALESSQNRASTSGPVAEGPTVSPLPRTIVVKAIVKHINPATFKRWLDGAPRRFATGDDVAKKFQRTHAGDEEILLKGGGEQVWADGVNLGDAHLVEIKHVNDPDTSPFIDGSKCGAAVRDMIRDQVSKEFKRYAAIINDPATPAVGLEVIVNDARAIPFLQMLMQQFGIPGRIRVTNPGTVP